MVQVATYLLRRIQYLLYIPLGAQTIIARGKMASFDSIVRAFV